MLAIRIALFEPWLGSLYYDVTRDELLAIPIVLFEPWLGSLFYDVIFFDSV